MARTPPSSVELTGVGLFSGASCAVRLVRAPGPLTVTLGGAAIPLAALEVRSADRRVVLGTGATTVELFEHVAAALAGRGVHAGVRVEVQGPELPLLDGGAAAFYEALVTLDAPRSGPSLEVARDAELAEGESRYAFRRAAGVELEVTIDFGLAWMNPSAAWRGDADDFARRIAPARTFVTAGEIEELANRGLAAHADPKSVVVLDASGPRAAGAPCLPDEPARHKLLDLAGDLFLHGGPPRGAVRALRPGHAATHRAVKRALAEGILVKSSA